MTHKPTDAEIIKALECCIDTDGANCHQCPYDECCSYPESIMLKDTLDLINHLKVEINNLKEANRRIDGYNGKLRNLVTERDIEIERLKEAKYIFATVDYCADDLDEALKENETLKAENEALISAQETLQKHIEKQNAEIERLGMGEYRHIGKTAKNAYREGIEAVLDRLRNIISLHTEGHISLGLKDIDLIESEMVGEIV